MSDDMVPGLPLQTWTLKNFKSVRDATVSFRPLTLLVGANSSGKSTVLQSMLLAAQSVQSGASSGAFGLNGQLVNLGTYDDVRNVLSQGRTSLGGSLALTVSVPDSNESDLARLSEMLEGWTAFSSQLPGPQFSRTHSPATSVVAWEAKLAVSGRNASGAALVGSIEVSLDAGAEGARQRYELRVRRVSDQVTKAAFWPGPQRFFAHRISARTETLASYSGRSYRVRPRARHEQIGAARFDGIFPVVLAAEESGVSSACRHWIDYALGERLEQLTQHFDEPGILDNAPWPPTGAEDPVAEITRCLIESMDAYRASEPGSTEWPWRLIDTLDMSWLSVPSQSQQVAPMEGAQPIAKILLALAFHDYVGQEEARANEPFHGVPGWEAWHYPFADQAEEQWNALAVALTGALREHGDDICRTVSEHFADAGSINVEPGPDSQLLMKAGSAAAEFFRHRVFYLGPLREDPHPVNRRSLVPGSSALGTKGEYMTAVLLDNADEVVDAPWPGSDELSRRQARLRDAVEEWLRFFDVAVALKMEETSLGPVLQIKDREGGKWLHLTHVGVGVSQLLPVIVLCLLAREGSVVMLEQPELHLHPALQQRLGDFLLACANSGRQLIVETHSEYIVSRLRRRIAAAPDDSLVTAVEILFAEKNDRGDTHFRPVRANEYGGIEEWPKGFFDQSSSEAQEILRAAVKKRKAVADEKTGKSRGRSGS